MKTARPRRLPIRSTSRRRRRPRRRPRRVAGPLPARVKRSADRRRRFSVALQYDDKKIYIGGEALDDTFVRTSKFGDGEDHASLAIAFLTSGGAPTAYGDRALRRQARRLGRLGASARVDEGDGRPGREDRRSTDSRGLLVRGRDPVDGDPEAHRTRVGFCAARYYDADSAGSPASSRRGRATSHAAPARGARDRSRAVDGREPARAESPGRPAAARRSRGRHRGRRDERARRRLRQVPRRLRLELPRRNEILLQDLGGEPISSSATSPAVARRTSSSVAASRTSRRRENGSRSWAPSAATPSRSSRSRTRSPSRRGRRK